MLRAWSCLAPHPCLPAALHSPRQLITHGPRAPSRFARIASLAMELASRKVVGRYLGTFLQDVMLIFDGDNVQSVVNQKFETKYLGRYLPIPTYLLGDGVGT